MKYMVKTYENNGKGFQLKSAIKYYESEAKFLLDKLKEAGFLRIKGNGLIGITMELNDLEKNIQITFERILD